MEGITSAAATATATTTTTTTTTASSSTTAAATTARRRSRRAPRILKFVPAPVGLPPLIHFQPLCVDAGSVPGAGEHRQSALRSLTCGLLDTYCLCNPTFSYDRRLNPRRVLTKPSKPTHNNGHDNEKHDYILYVNDVLGNEEGRKYIILDLLGQGTFGQVVKCQNVETAELVAVKVIKNQAAFFNQSMMEVTVLELLNQRYDKEDRHHIVRMRDTFVFRQHLCIVVELLSLNLYDLIKQNQYRGFSLTLCRIFCQQILDALRVLREARIIHCDLKPENILLRNLESPQIKVIDFGSACHEHQTLYTYIQSRFYRSPEVLLGLPYSSSIDMWSLGCIAAELFLGLPIFPGASNYDQVSRIVQTMGNPPSHMLEVGKETLTYFERRLSLADGQPIATKFQLKTRERYNLDTNRMEPPPKQYFSSTKLDEIILNYPIRPRDMSAKDKEHEMAQRRCFLDFVRGILNLNPIERWSPLQAAQHPFITGKPFLGPFVPQPLHSTPIPVALSAASGATSATTATTGAAPTTREAIAVATGRGNRRPTSRPRANTLSSLSLQDVPPQIQRVAAAAGGRDRQAPSGIGPRERDNRLPEAVSVAAAADFDAPHGLPFEDSALAFSPPSIGGSYTCARNLPAANAGHATNKAPGPAHAINAAHSNQHTERMNAYVSNRRVSQPAAAILSGGRYGHPRNSNVGLPPGYVSALHAGSSSSSTGAPIIPASLPNAVWYGPEPFASPVGPVSPTSKSSSNAVRSPYHGGGGGGGGGASRRGFKEGSGVGVGSGGGGGGTGSPENASNASWRRRASLPGNAIAPDNRNRRASATSLLASSMAAVDMDEAPGGAMLIDDDLEESGTGHNDPENARSGSSSMMDVLDEADEDEPDSHNS